jgi:hypothetical protein
MIYYLCEAGEGFHCLLAFPNCLSVIEEKGEGFENGKNFLACLVLAFNLNGPPRRITRLKILDALLKFVEHK